MRLDLGELVLHVIRVHSLDLLSRWRTEHLDDLHQLVDPTLSREQGLAQHQLCHNAVRRPDIYEIQTIRLNFGKPISAKVALTDIDCVVGRAKDELWRSIVSGADIANVWLAGDQDLR